MMCEKLCNKEPFHFMYLFILFRLYVLVYGNTCCTCLEAEMYIVHWRNSFLVHSILPEILQRNTSVKCCQKAELQSDILRRA
jgi:hypothetical protein